jgi:hypothetical protein
VVIEKNKIPEDQGQAAPEGFVGFAKKREQK